MIVTPDRVTAEPNWHCRAARTNAARSTHRPYQREQSVSLQRAECNICLLVWKLTRKQIGPGSLLGPPSAPRFDVQNGRVTLPLSVQGKEFYDVSRSPKGRPPQDPEQRSGGLNRWRDLQCVPRKDARQDGSWGGGGNRGGLGG